MKKSFLRSLFTPYLGSFGIGTTNESCQSGMFILEYKCGVRIANFNLNLYINY